MGNATLATYGGLTQDALIQGQIADAQVHNILSGPNSGSIAIDLGNAVAQGAADGQVKAPTADGDKIVGLAVRQAAMQSNSSAQTVYGQYETVAYMRHGTIGVVCTEAYAAGDAVLSKTAGNGTIGSTTGGAAGTGRVAVPGAVFLTSGLANTVGKVRINN